MRESRKRSVSKTITWRVVATGTTIALVYIATGDIEIAATIGAADVAIKTVLYYLHERSWTRISWGR